MEIRVKTRVGQIIFTDIEPGMSMDANIENDARVHLYTTSFRQIKRYNAFDSVTTYIDQEEDDMVKVHVSIKYKKMNYYVDLGSKEVSINTKKVKFKDKTGYVVVIKE